MSPDDVVRCNRYQTSGYYHPMTCANRGDGNHRTWNGDLGALVATVRGWECPFCDYRQDWAPAQASVFVKEESGRAWVSASGAPFVPQGET